MKKYKQILALLLVFCTLVSVAMPTVFATETGAEDPAGENTPGAVVPEPVDYVFYTPERASKTFREESPAISAAYQEGISNWRYEAADTAYQFRLKGEADNKNGGSIFTTTQKSIQFVSAASNSSNTRFFAVRIQSPGAGRFDLTLTHGAGVNGATKSSMYIVDADIVEGILGENAQAYADAMAQDIYLNTSDAYAAYKTAIVEAIKEKTAAMTINFYDESNKVDVTTEGSYFFEADKEYIVILTADAGKQAGIAYLYMNMLSAVYSEDQSEEVPEQPEVPEEPEIPEGPGYTEGVYDFYQGVQSGVNLAEGIEAIAAQYEAGTLNWKYETHSGVNLNKVTYQAGIRSVKALSARNWWLAFRIKAPGEDGAYDIKMTHGAGGDGATAGSIYVIPGDTPENQIFKVASKKDPTMTTDWFYGEVAADTIGGRETTTGSVNLRAGQEYIVVFLPTEKSNLNSNASFYMGQLTVTRTGEYVEDSGDEDGVDGVEYEFYDWDNPGHYVNHYKTEEQLGKKILKDKLEQEYADGTRNWAYVTANGYANFSTGMPYLIVNVGETHYYALKIKSPGTGTYEITYKHLAMKDAAAGSSGSVFILPYEAGMDYATIRDEANFKDPIITTTYYAEQTSEVLKVGTYTAFQEGKEYLVCFSVDDADVTEVKTLKAYPVSMIMKRTGDYISEEAANAPDGIAYKLAQKEFAGKKYDEVNSVISARYDSGSMNWKFESGVGSSRFYSKYIQFGTGAAGKCWAIRIKAPGTGEYKVTLDYIKNFAPNAANIGKIYIKEAPEETIANGALNDHLVQMPIMEFSYSCGGTRMQRASSSGTYMFREDKEYIVFFYGEDTDDSRNTSTSTYMYADRLVMKRIGDYVEREKAINAGGIVAENVLTQFKSEGYMLTQMNGHDYLVFTMFGGTMLIYDLDEWRLVDEVNIGIETPRSICTDLDGNWWIAGASQSLYCYNPYTREGFLTSKFSGGGDHFEVVCDPEDGNLYLAAYSDHGIIIYRVNPRTLDVTSYRMESWSRYPGPGSCIIEGDYMYVTASSGDRCEVWKVNKRTCTIVDRADITNRTKGERYVYNMSFMGNHHLLVYSAYGLLAVDTRDMSLLYGDAVGLKGTTSRIASEPIDGKCYFVTNAEGLCYFDLETETFGAVGGELANFKTGLRVPNMATIDDSRLTEETMISFGSMTASGVSLYAINLETKIAVELIGLVEPGMGTGVNAHTLFNGEPGTNEIIYGPMYPDFPARVYNATTGELARTFMTNGQNDSGCWYNGKMYFGNYSSAILTEMNNGQAIKLFTLNDENFNQSRVHGICGGGNKVFIGTIPDNYVFGGVIAWYDLETELTYVVTGPNPEDVYYANASKVTVTNEWYSVVTGELVDMTKEWDYDNDGDGVNDHFSGPIPLQSIIKVTYSDGLLYGVSSLRAGSGAGETPNATSMIFVYDVENFKMLKTIDVADYIDGIPKTIRTVKSLEVDPDISNKLWGMVAETLFSVTYDRDTNKVTIKEEISFDKTRISKTSSDCTPIIFDGDDMYVLFGALGGLRKINRYDLADNTVVMGDFDLVSQVPTSFILGDDGDIYYISVTSPHIYVLNVDITDEERASAKAVQDAIDLIPDEITLADRETITAARAAWDAMPKANQPLVNNLEKLELAEIALLVLRIDALSDDITIEDEQELVSIRAEYMALDLEQRLSIDFKKVSDAESKMSIFRGERTTNLINALGVITLEDEEAIRAARASYMALTRYERTLVTNIELLNQAESDLTFLLLSKNEAGAVDQKIEEIGFVFFSDSKIKIAREAYDALSDTAKEMVTKYDALQKAETTLIVEYVIAVLLIVGGAAVTVIILRKKKVKAE